MENREGAMIRRTMLGLMVAASVGPAMAQGTGPVPGRTYSVGFSQIVDHPALNATRQGFIDGLKEAGFVEGKNLTFMYQNAQGDVANARNITEKFIADKVDLIAPCTTPNVQAAIRLTRGTQMPVAFGCVTNPVEGGILTSTDKPTGSNVTGIYGTPPVQKMWDLVVGLRPKTKVVGTIYNPSESNSIALNAANKAEAVKRGFTWAEVQVASSADVMAAARALTERVDCLLMPQDNTVASAFDAIVIAAREAKVPVFSFDTSTVERGAIAAYAQDQRQAGLDWAREVAVPVLLGKPAGTIVPVQYKAYSLLLNRGAATAAGVVLPEALQKAAVKVWEQ